MSVIFGINKRGLKPHALRIVPVIIPDKFNTELRLLPDCIEITRV